MNIFNYIKKELNDRNINAKILMLTKSGSHLYGTNTENSDEDYLGIFVPLDKKYYYGFQNIEEIDLSKQIKDATGKNTKDSIDLKLYDLRKFVKLAAQCNPNIIELLFASTNKQACLYITPEFKILAKNKDYFLNKRIYNAFLGYANSQLKKGKQKPENFRIIKEFKETLENILQKNKEYGNLPLGEGIQIIPELKKYKPYLNKEGIRLVHLTFPRNYFLKKILNMVKEKVKASSHRAKAWEKYGYDPKFFLHLFRLLDEGEMLIKKGYLKFPLHNRKFLLDIRKGKYSLEELEEMIEKKLQKFKNIDLSHLPKTANNKKLEEITVNIIDNIINNPKNNK